MSEYKMDTDELKKVASQDIVKIMLGMGSTSIGLGNVYLKLLGQYGKVVEPAKNAIISTAYKYNGKLFSNASYLKSSIADLAVTTEEGDSNASTKFGSISGEGNFIIRAIIRSLYNGVSSSMIQQKLSNVYSRLTDLFEEPYVIILNGGGDKPRPYGKIEVERNDKDSSSSKSNNQESKNTNDTSPSAGYRQAVNSNSDYYKNRIGQTIGNIKDANGNFTEYYGNGNLSYRGGYEGECTWYAYGRFYELTGIKLNTAPHAKSWLSANSNDPRLSISDVPAPGSIAVKTSGDYGHVMIIEDVTYNEDGSIDKVYITEANVGDNNGKNNVRGRYDEGIDGVLKEYSYQDFIDRKKPSGYISAKQ